MTWEQDVAIPAAQANEGRHFLIDTKFAEVSYEIAPIAKGWAVSVHCGYLCGDGHTCDIPWSRFATRAECLDLVLEQAKIHFTYEVSFPAQQRAQKAILKLLEDMKEIDEASLVRLSPAKCHVANIAQKKPNQGLLF